MESNLFQNTPIRSFSFAFLTSLLAFVVIILGAYTRLSDAGLGCPDWPGCYGQLIFSESISAKAQALKLFPSQPIDSAKAWIEMTHRYMASLLGLCIVILAFINYQNYRKQIHKMALPRLPWILVALVIFQGVLGKWTVTLKLLPLVVMAHLIGGMTTLALLWWLTLTCSTYRYNGLRLPAMHLKTLRCLSLLALSILTLQIILGAWTSANYAALVCPDFPLCQGLLWPNSWNTAFDLFSMGTPDSEQAMHHQDRITVQMVHRIGAYLLTFCIGILSFILWKRTRHATRTLNFTLIFLLGLQLCLGILNVLLKLPLVIALAHNAVATLLLLTIVTLNYRLGTLCPRINT